MTCNMGKWPSDEEMKVCGEWTSQEPSHTAKEPDHEFMIFSKQERTHKRQD